MALINCPECEKQISSQCEACPHCGYPLKSLSQNIVEKEPTELINQKKLKKPLYKTIWFWIVISVIVVAVGVGLYLFLWRNTKPKLDKNGDPIFIAFTNEVYTNADDYKGYYVEISGKVFNLIGDYGDVKAIQIWLDPDSSDKNTIIYYSTDVDVKDGDYIKCSGYIDSKTKYKNSFGQTQYAPLIISKKLEIVSYFDVVDPAIETKSFEDYKLENDECSISLNKLEFSEKETRVYVTIQNSGFSDLYYHSSFILQGKKQFNSIDKYDIEYNSIPHKIVSGQSCTGIIVFPKMNLEDIALAINVKFELSSNNISQAIFLPGNNLDVEDLENYRALMAAILYRDSNKGQNLSIYDLYNHLEKMNFTSEAIVFAVENAEGFDTGAAS